MHPYYIVTVERKPVDDFPLDERIEHVGLFTTREEALKECWCQVGALYRTFCNTVTCNRPRDEHSMPPPEQTDIGVIVQSPYGDRKPYLLARIIEVIPHGDVYMNSDVRKYITGDTRNAIKTSNA